MSCTFSTPSLLKSASPANQSPRKSKISCTLTPPPFQSQGHSGTAPYTLICQDANVPVVPARTSATSTDHTPCERSSQWRTLVNTYAL